MAILASSLYVTLSPTAAAEMGERSEPRGEPRHPFAPLSSPRPSKQDRPHTYPSFLGWRHLPPFGETIQVIPVHLQEAGQPGADDKGNAENRNKRHSEPATDAVCE